MFINIIWKIIEFVFLEVNKNKIYHKYSSKTECIKICLRNVSS